MPLEHSDKWYFVVNCCYTASMNFILGKFLPIFFYFPGNLTHWPICQVSFWWYVLGSFLLKAFLAVFSFSNIICVISKNNLIISNDYLYCLYPFSNMFTKPFFVCYIKMWYIIRILTISLNICNLLFYNLSIICRNSIL